MRPPRIASLAFIIALIVAGFFGSRFLGERDARRESERHAEVAAAQIRARVEQGASVAEGLRRFVGETVVTSREFTSNASRWLSPAGFAAAAWVQQVPASRRGTYERRTGQPIVTRGRGGRIAPVGSRSSYLPATLVSGIAPMAVAGIDLGGEPGMASALARASASGDARATSLAPLRDGTEGLFLITSAPRLTGAGNEPGFVVVFVSEPWLRAAATDTPALQLAAGGSPTGDRVSATTVRR